MQAHIITCTLALALLSATPARAETPQDMLSGYQAGVANFKGFSAERGQALYQNTQGGDWSCSSCHTKNPLAEGKHAVTGKRIAALSPNANPDRFTNPGKTEKWFKRNCNDVLKRECSPQEKGDLLTYLISLK